MNKSESKYFNTAILMDEALMYLLEKKDFKYITVKEICKKAGVNRSTFYLHYENMDDLLSETIEMINKKFMSSFNNQNDEIKNIQQATKEDVNFIKPKYLTPYLEFIKENRLIYKTIHNNTKLFGVDKMFYKMYKEIFEPALQKYDIPQNDVQYIFDFFMHGIIAIVKKWISLDCKDEIEYIQNLILDCVDYKNRVQNIKNKQM